MSQPAGVMFKQTFDPTAVTPWSRVSRECSPLDSDQWFGLAECTKTSAFVDVRRRSSNFGYLRILRQDRKDREVGVRTRT